jgi:hypothetical protein
MSQQVQEFEVPKAEIIKAENAAVVASGADMWGSLLQIALTNNSAIDVIERLLALRREDRAKNAETEFNEALNKAQAEMVRIAPDLKNSQTNSKYASYAALDRMVRPIYTKHGFSLSFDEEDSPKTDHVRVVAFLSRGSHTRRYKKDICADGKGAKGGDVMTRTHAEAAADSYGMRYLTKKIFNLAIGEDDDDGNLMPENQERDFLSNIEAASNMQELEQAYKVAIAAGLKAQDPGVVKLFMEARKKRQMALGAA